MKPLRFLAFCIVAQLAPLTQQTTGPLLEVTGDISQPRTFQQQEWKQLKHVTVTATNAHDKKTATYNGVPLRDLLKDAGVPSGESLRGKVFTTTIIVSATDGYQVAFSVGELDESVGNLQVLVADNEDGKPLAQETGPLRLVVPSDKRPARWVRMVKTIRVVANPSAALPR